MIKCTEGFGRHMPLSRTKNIYGFVLQWSNYCEPLKHKFDNKYDWCRLMYFYLGKEPMGLLLVKYIRYISC